jgi:hypothetical protein
MLGLREVGPGSSRGLEGATTGRTVEIIVDKYLGHGGNVRKDFWDISIVTRGAYADHQHRTRTINRRLGLLRYEQQYGQASMVKRKGTILVQRWCILKDNRVGIEQKWVGGKTANWAAVSSLHQETDSRLCQLTWR